MVCENCYGNHAARRSDGQHLCNTCYDAAFTERHFQNWLKDHVADDERSQVERQMRAMLAADPAIVDTRTWPEIRRAAEIQFAPMVKPQPKGVKLGAYDV
jgi:hypothetical protein